LHEHNRSPDEPFKGDPLDEAFEELVDCLNYLDEFQKQIKGPVIKELERQVFWATLELKSMLEFRDEHGHLEESVEEILDERFS
jgi:hypothetical protein